jgi:hypothetical protein
MTEDQKSLSQRKEIIIKSSDGWNHVHINKVVSRADDWIEIRTDTGELVSAYFRPVYVDVKYRTLGSGM